MRKKFSKRQLLKAQNAFASAGSVLFTLMVLARVLSRVRPNTKNSGQLKKVTALPHCRWKTCVVAGLAGPQFPPECGKKDKNKNKDKP